MTKTLLVGLDAACWEYVNPLLEANRLPTLKGLMETGVWGALRSTMPAWTPTAWTSIITGKNPGKHGIFDMVWRRPGSYEFFPTNARMRWGSPFWRWLNEAGLRVGLVNIPFTHPPEPMDGFLVCGFGTPNSAPERTYPPDLLPQIERQFGPYIPAVDPLFLRTAPPDEILRVEREHQRRQVQIALALARSQQVDVLAINLMLTDHANHKMPDMERVRQAYCHADEDLRRLIDGFQPDNVMLISDHGSSRLKGIFLLNAWLRDRGYYVPAPNTSAEQSAALNWLLVQWLQTRYGLKGLPEKVLRRLARETIRRLPESIARPLWRKVENHLPFAREHVRYNGQPDYARTPLYFGSVYSGLLYLNRADREPNGIIPPAEAAGLAREIADQLAQIPDPDTGEPILPAVYTAGELYNGPALNNAPDLILDGYGGAWNLQMSHYTPTFEQPRNRYFLGLGHRRDYGWHSRDGLFVFSGAPFTTGPATAAGHVMDIPATLLHLHGVPVPNDYDGRVLTETMTADFLEQHPLRTQEGDGDEAIPLEFLYSSEEEAELTAHLRALGYLE